jgi:hypothetical protein
VEPSFVDITANETRNREYWTGPPWEIVTPEIETPEFESFLTYQPAGTYTVNAPPGSL